jgi:hypothetical protein
MTLAFSLLDTAGPVVKKRYDDRKVWDLTFGQNKLLGWLPRKTGITGKSYEVPVTLANIAGGSAVFSEAVASRKGTQHQRWSATRIKSYQTATIDNETLRSMKDDKGAFFRAVTSQLDSAYRAFGSDTGWALYQDGSGVRGTVETVADEVVTVGAGESRSFALGMRCTIYDSTDADLAGTPNATNVRVVGIDRSTETITFDTDLDTVAGDVVAVVAAGDFIVRAGDENAKVKGLAACFPDPTGITAGDSFYGVDRSVYKERLLGLHYDGSGDADFGVALRKAGAVGVENEGLEGEIATIMNPIDLGTLDVALDGDREFDKVASQKGHIGFDAIKVHLGGVISPVISDAWCPAGTAYMLQRNTFDLFSIDRIPDFVSEDGNMLHRLEGADEVEFRIGGYFNLLCRAPGKNVVVALV